MAGGRPTKYNEALAQEICVRLAEGESLRSICEDKDDKYPSKTTVMRWLFDDKYIGFRDHYERARRVQAEGLADELTDIADDGSNDWMKKHRGEMEIEVINNEAIQRSRLRVDTRKWIASKLLPKKYGDKVQQEVTGANGGPQEHKWVVEFVEGKNDDTKA